MLDFLIPYHHIEIMGRCENNRNLVGKWFNGLFVTLQERQVCNRFQMDQLLSEVQILKNIRHPNLEMHLGVTYTIQHEEDDDKNITYRFYMITENIELQHHHQQSND